MGVNICGEFKKSPADCGEKMLVNAFNSYYTKVFHFFCGHLSDYAQAQDLAGEVFLRAASAWSTYDASKGAISTWIFAIAQNILKDYWRKKRFVLVELEEAQGSSDIEENMEFREDREALRKAMSFLSEKEREVIRLKYFGGLKNTEIAELTGLSASNTAVTAYRALEKLREHLKKYL